MEGKSQQHSLIVAAALLALLAVAAFLRLHQIDTIPPGLYPDEALNGNDATRVLDLGDFRVFYSDNSGREGLFIHLTALSLWLYGHEIAALRIVSAVAGVLTVWGLFLMTRRMFDLKTAFTAAALLTCSFWHVLSSRTAFRSVLVPLVLVFAFYFLWRGMQRLSYWDFAASGVFWGLGVHTYPSYRIMPLVTLVGVVAFWAQGSRNDAQRRKHGWDRRFVLGICLSFFAAAIVAAPMVLYALLEPSVFWQRAREISVLAEADPVMMFLDSIRKTLFMFHVQGDPNWRHNLDARPMLSVPAGVCFALGLAGAAWTLVRWKGVPDKQAEKATALAWLVLGLLPTVLSANGLPHALRSLNVVPIVYVFAALGWQHIEQFIRSGHAAGEGKHAGRREGLWRQRAATGALIAFIGYQAAVGYHRYFVLWGRDERTAVAFWKSSVELGHKLNELPRDQRKEVPVGRNPPWIFGLPWAAQTVIFVTDTATREKRKAKNIIYLREGSLPDGKKAPE